MSLRTVDYRPSIRVIFTGDEKAVSANFYEVKDGKTADLIGSVAASAILVKTESSGAEDYDSKLGIVSESPRLLSSFPYGIQVKIVQSIKVTDFTRPDSSFFRWMTADIRFYEKPAVKDVMVTDPRVYKYYSGGILEAELSLSDTTIARVKYATGRVFECHRTDKGLIFKFYNVSGKMPSPIGMITSFAVDIIVDSKAERNTRENLGIGQRNNIKLGTLPLEKQDSLMRSIRTDFTDTGTDNQKWREVKEADVTMGANGVQSMQVWDVREYDL